MYCVGCKGLKRERKGEDNSPGLGLSPNNNNGGDLSSLVLLGYVTYTQIGFISSFYTVTVYSIVQLQYSTAVYCKIKQCILGCKICKRKTVLGFELSAIVIQKISLDIPTQFFGPHLLFLDPFRFALYSL